MEDRIYGKVKVLDSVKLVTDISNGSRSMATEFTDYISTKTLKYRHDNSTGLGWM